jgi:hypothetical protein
MLEHMAALAEAPVDEAIFRRHVAQTVRDGAALMALRDGAMMGFLGLMQSQYCYSSDHFLHDTGLCVSPAERGGTVLRALLAEARGIADAAGMPLKIIDTNGARERVAKGQLAKTAEIIGYRPAGRVLTFKPRIGPGRLSAPPIK